MNLEKGLGSGELGKGIGQLEKGLGSDELGKGIGQW